MIFDKFWTLFDHLKHCKSLQTNGLMQLFVVADGSNTRRTRMSYCRSIVEFTQFKAGKLKADEHTYYCIIILLYIINIQFIQGHSSLKSLDNQTKTQTLFLH